MCQFAVAKGVSYEIHRMGSSRRGREIAYRYPALRQKITGPHFYSPDLHRRRGRGAHRGHSTSNCGFRAAGRSGRRKSSKDGAMSANVTSLADISSWARGSGLEIALLVTGTILLTRLATWAGARITDRIDANARETDTLVRSEASKHRHALAQVITLDHPGGHLLRGRAAHRDAPGAASLGRRGIPWRTTRTKRVVAGRRQCAKRAFGLTLAGPNAHLARWDGAAGNKPPASAGSRHEELARSKDCRNT